MADCLVYWKTYRDDYQRDGNSALTAEWFTEYRYFPDQIRQGDNLWVVVQAGENHPDEWRLIQQIYIEKVEFDTNSGQWHAKGNDKKSKIFDINGQSDFSSILHKLNFASGKSITTKGKLIGRSIQRSRPLSISDIALLKQYAKTLKTKQGRSPKLLEKGDSDQESPVSSMGAGFGEPERNLQVEKAAISFVIRRYKKQGWHVKSVEQQKRGFDLICYKGNIEEHVEVKGVSGSICTFIITSNEIRQAKHNSKFILCVVTEALSKTPKLDCFSGKDFLQRFSLEALQYKAVMKSSAL